MHAPFNDEHETGQAASTVFQVFAVFQLFGMARSALLARAQSTLPLCLAGSNYSFVAQLV